MDGNDAVRRPPSRKIGIKVLLIVSAILLTALTVLPRIFADNADLATRLTRKSTMAERQSALAEMKSLDATAQQNLIPELRAALSSKNSYVRQNAAQTLGELDQAAASAMDDLKRLQLDRVKSVRRTASISLARMGLVDDALLRDLSNELLEMSSDDNLSHQTEAKLIRYSAANALGFIASGSNPMDVSASVPALIQTLTSDPDPDVRNRAAWAIGSIGSKAQSALPALALASHDAKVSFMASWAIDRVKH